MTFKEVVEEFGKDDIPLAYEIWATAKTRRVDITPTKRKEVDSVAKKEVEKPKGRPKKNNELGAKVLAIMEALRKNGVTETTSTVLRDKLGTKNRGVIRQVMRRLEKQGKVVIEKKEFGKRKQYVYRLAG